MYLDRKLECHSEGERGRKRERERERERGEREREERDIYIYIYIYIYTEKGSGVPQECHRSARPGGPPPGAHVSGPFFAFSVVQLLDHLGRRRGAEKAGFWSRSGSERRSKNTFLVKSPLLQKSVFSPAGARKTTSEG